MANIVTFELQVDAIDYPTPRRRWNGGPMPSAEANVALYAAVEAFWASLRGSGFTPAHSGYGVRVRNAPERPQEASGGEGINSEWYRTPSMLKEFPEPHIVRKEDT